MSLVELALPSKARASDRTKTIAEPEPTRLANLERRLAFLVPLVVALPTAWVLVIHYHSIYQDAMTRVANAYYVLYSRDPHLAAIGFVWTPLPSILEMPLLLFKGVWPALTREAFAGSIMSCLYYALACHQIYRYCEDLGVRRLARWGLWLAFAANPLVFYYGLNGMSEILLVLIFIFCTRQLTEYLRSGDSGPLILAGVGLAAGYMVRNEATAAVLASGVVVLIFAYGRAAGDRRTRRVTAITDLALYISPFVMAFAIWALISWVIVGSPLEGFTSINGQVEQFKLSGQYQVQATLAGRLGFAVHGALSVAPFLPAVLLVALLWRLRKGDMRVLAPVTIPLAAVMFNVSAYTARTIFPEYRFYIYACPAVVMMAAHLASNRANERAGSARDVFRSKARCALAVLMSLVGIVTVAATLGSETQLAQADRFELAYILWPHAHDASLDVPRGLEVDVQLARLFDSLNPGNGGVLVDNATCGVPPIILNSRHPKEFAIPNDEDYLQKFGDPYQFGVRYALAPDPSQEPVDQVDTRLPSLYGNGGGMATLVRQLVIPGCGTFRVYRFLPSSN